MKNWTREIIAGSALVALLGGGGLWAANAGILNSPAPTPTAVVEEAPTPTPTVVTSTPSPTPTAEPVVAPIVEAPAPPPVVEEPSGPVLCPPGTQSNGNDGVNDTSCLPDVCWTIPVPDPAHPECDYAYPPEYYY